MKKTALHMSFTHGYVCLQFGHGLSLMDAMGVKLKSLTGRLWLTMEGDDRDIDLRPGSAFTIDRDGLTLVNAVEPSLVQVRVPPAPMPGWRHSIKRLWDLLVRASQARARARMARGHHLY